VCDASHSYSARGAISMGLSNRSETGRQPPGWRWSEAESAPRLPDDVARRPKASLTAGTDVVLALGGDGTMLGALRLAAPDGVPVLGINLGTLGYLTQVDAADLETALAARCAEWHAGADRL